MKNKERFSFLRVGKGWLFAAGTVLMLCIVFYAWRGSKNNNWEGEQGEKEQLLPPVNASFSPTELLFGFPADSFAVHRSSVRKNQFLADILMDYKVPYPVVDRLVQSASPVFDVRKLRVGKPFTVLCSDDTLQSAQYFIYEENPVDYVVFQLTDSLKVYRAQKPIEIKERMVSGIVEYSLYETMIAAGVSPLLAMDLADIYAWTIDFYRLQKGDAFKAVFLEKYVDGESIGVERVEASWFSHRGEEFYAFSFEQDSALDYFDEAAASLRKAFLKSPIRYSRISSRYSKRRFHPVQKRFKAHLGTDYAAPHGTPIRSVGDGVVTEAKRKRFNGNYVKIKHNSIYSTQYLHMSKFAKGIKPGKKVKQGDVIGYVGSTGLATGPHVCFRFWKHGTQVDHLREKFPPSKPVLKENLPAFDLRKNELLKKLDEISFQEELISAKQ